MGGKTVVVGLGRLSNGEIRDWRWGRGVVFVSRVGLTGEILCGRMG